MGSLFDATVTAIVGTDRDLDERLIQGLSDATRSQAQWFRTQFASCPPARRRDLFQRMVDLSEQRFEIDFSSLFRACLDDEDAVVRRLCIEGLWEDTRPGLARRLIARLRDDNDLEVRAAAASALGRFVFMAECDEIDAALGARIRAALESVIMEGADIEVMRRAIESIAYINDARTRAIIEDAYKHESQRMRESAVFAMGRNADTHWRETILLELRAALPAMRYEAARAAGEMMLRSAVIPVIELVEDPDAEVRAMAVWALGQIGGKRARAVIERLVKGSDEALAAAAEEALAEIEFTSASMDLFVYNVSEDDGSSEGEDEEDASEDWDGDALRLP